MTKNLRYWITRFVRLFFFSLVFHFSSIVPHLNQKLRRNKIFSQVLLRVVINFPLFAEDSGNRIRHIESHTHSYTAQMGQITCCNFSQWNDWQRRERSKKNDQIIARVENRNNFAYFSLLSFASAKCLIFDALFSLLLPVCVYYSHLSFPNFEYNR